MDIVDEIKEEPIGSPDSSTDYNNHNYVNNFFSVDIKYEKNEEDNIDCDDSNGFVPSEGPLENDLCPLVQISELNEDLNLNVSVSGIHEHLKTLGYKNPFVYTKLKRKRLKKQREEKGTKWKCVTDEVCCSVTEKDCLEPQNSTNAKWQCMICSDMFPSKNDLMKHYENHKTEADIKKGSAIQGNYFMCPVCSAEFTSATMYDNHIELKHGESQSICKTCNKPFKNLYLLCIHNYNKHSSHTVYKCTCCEFEHKDSRKLKMHIKEEHEKYNCEVCNKSFTALSWYEEHKNFHNEDTKLKCEICLQCFPYARTLVAHKKKNHPEIFANLSVCYSCKLCDQKFPNMKSLASHLRSHNGPSSLLCDLCGKSLSCYDHLKKHLRVHSGEKPFKCNVCGKGFSDKCNLKLHERVHSGEKPYICNVCKKRFSQRSSLVIHGRLHSGERPYKCELCGKGFVAKGLINVHKKSCMGMFDE